MRFFNQDAATCWLNKNIMLQTLTEALIHRVTLHSWPAPGSYVVVLWYLYVLCVWHVVWYYLGGLKGNDY